MDNNVFINMSYGVYVVTTMDGDRPVGCTCNAVMQITAEPSVAAVSINHNNYTNECIKKYKKVGVTIIAEDSDPGVIGRFGFYSSRDTDKFDGIDYVVDKGLAFPETGCGYFMGNVIGSYEAETHTVFFVNVTDGEKKDGIPMTYSYYHNVIKGRSPKNAPTYISD